MTSPNGQIKAIALTPVKRAPMEIVTSCVVTVESGIEGDARGTRQGRQVTFLFESAWVAACADLGQDLSWTLRRANLLVSDMDTPCVRGKRIAVGSAEFIITQETNPCALMEKQAKGLMGALTPDWRGGVCCRVAKGGNIAQGDPVRLLS